jgi:CubicO group peptidase (beta-lactamase class C family)
MTKQFTAALIMLLQQDGKLSVNDLVSKYLPEVPASWDKITIAEVLNHTSGIPDFVRDKSFGTWAASEHRPGVDALLLIRDKPLDFAPGTKFQYSNSNFEVLGLIIQKLSGKPYGDVLRGRIFGPLEMTNTGLDDDLLVLPKRAYGYNPIPQAMAARVRSRFPDNVGLLYAHPMSLSVPWAAGAMYSTTGDLLRWERGLFGGKVLSADSLRAMTTPGKGDYGFGLFIYTRDGLEVVEHGGKIIGFRTELIYVPEKKITVAVLSNVEGGPAAAMAGQLLDVALGNPVTLGSEVKPAPISKDEAAKFIGSYGEDPSFEIVAAGDGLAAKMGPGPGDPLVYEGVKNGHSFFYLARAHAEYEFVPDSNGAIASMVLHDGVREIKGDKH